MNQDEVVRLENISVRYRLPHERIGKFKEYMIRLLQGRMEYDTFLALQDVSLTVRRGEVFGLIGHNGAGKSTLLKLVARVMRPSGGRVWVRGRVAPLLELGAGFHPELTGRENIFLNGAILGFSRREMSLKLDRIVEFAELEEFIDAPMRTYSSGMWLRLGFAVATDVQPDILIVDETLAVGDEAFQRKGLERIQRFQEQGTTILLVSHSLSMVESLCQRVALLDHGHIIRIGPAAEVVALYRSGGGARPARAAIDRIIPPGRATLASSWRWGTRQVEIMAVRLVGETGQEQQTFQTGGAFVLEIDYEAHEPIRSPIFGFAVYRHDGVHLTGPNTAQAGFDLPVIQGRGTLRYRTDRLALLEGLYEVSVAIVNENDTITYDFHNRLYTFHVANREQTGQFPGSSGEWRAEKNGLVSFLGSWEQER